MTLWAQKRTAQSGELVMLPIWLLKGADVAKHPPSFLIAMADSLPAPMTAARLEHLRGIQRAYANQAATATILGRNEVLNQAFHREVARLGGDVLKR